MMRTSGVCLCLIVALIYEFGMKNKLIIIIELAGCAFEERLDASHQLYLYLILTINNQLRS